MMYETDSDDDDLENLRFIFSCRKQERSIKYNYLRVNWDEHIERLVHNNKIEQEICEQFCANEQFLRPVESSTKY